MSIEVLISTMDRDDLGFLESMNTQGANLLIINQISEKSGAAINIRKENIICRSYVDRGLSKSRNKAIEFCSGEICVIADDDIEYRDGFEETIISAFDQYKMADIIIFDYETNSLERKGKTLGLEGMSLGKRDILKVSSVRIAFRRQSITDCGVKFDERFGAGARFPSGEENLFLKDCLAAGLRIIYVPKVICDVNFDSSSWFSGYTPIWFVTKGAFARVYFTFLFSHFYILYFVFFKYSLYKKDSSIRGALVNMYKGYLGV